MRTAKCTARPGNDVQSKVTPSQPRDLLSGNKPPLPERPAGKPGLGILVLFSDWTMYISSSKKSIKQSINFFEIWQMTTTMARNMFLENEAWESRFILFNHWMLCVIKNHPKSQSTNQSVSLSFEIWQMTAATERNRQLENQAWE